MRNLMDWTGRILASMKLGQWGARLALLAGILLLPVPGQAVTGVNWKIVNPSPSGVVWGGAQFVSVGNGGTISTSPNGIAWTAQISGTTNSLAKVAWSGTQFVAVGNLGTILTSPNGIAWTPRTSGTTMGLSGVVWSGTQFVAVGDLGTILTSPDGIIWTLRISGTTSVLLGVAWGGTQFVAVGAGGVINILTSPDGVTWTQRTSGTTMGLNGVVWGGTQFVAVGYDGTMFGNNILTSPDGITWTVRNSGVAYASFIGVTWSGTQFVVVGSGAAILTSPNGITWTVRNSGVANSLIGVTWSGTQFVVVGSGPTILTSPNGITWTPRLSNTTVHLNGVAWSGTQFVAVGDGGRWGGAIRSSPDGITWTNRIGGKPLLGIIWSGTQFAAVGLGGAILTSPDGVTWSARVSGTLETLNSVTWSGTQFVAVGGGIWGASTIRTSPDGIVWTVRAPPVGAGGLNGVTWSGTQFVAVGSIGTILTSPDGVIWTKRVSGTTISLNGVVWSGTQFVAVGSGFGMSSSILTSPDGIIWTARITPPIALYSITWNGTQFVAVGVAMGANGNNIMTSPDGITWTSVTAAAVLYSIVWGGTQFVAVGREGIILTSGSATATGLTMDAKAVPLGDVNGNLMPEVAVLYREATGANAIYIKDGLSGALIRKITLAAGWAVLDLQAVPDINANGKQELAVLMRNATTGAVAVQVVDAFTGLLLSNIPFASNPWTPLALRVAPDLNANGKPELAVLLRHTTGAVQAKVMDASTGLLVKNVAFTGWTPLDMQVVPDINANGKPELAVLLRNASTGTVIAQVTDAFSGLLVKNVAFTGNPWTPLGMQVVPDLNANGKSELAVLMRNTSTGAVQAQAMDAFSGLLVKNAAFTGNPWMPLALRVVPDINANGKSELAVLMRNPTSGATLVQVSDASTGLLVRNVSYGVAFSPRDLGVLPDTNANGKPDLAVLGANSATEAARVQIHDSLTGALLRNIAVP